MKIGSANYWTPLRNDLRSWFQRNAQSLGELYEGAVEILSQERFPGRVRFVAHAVREIRNRLPEVIAGPKAGGTLQYKNRLDDIASAWKKARLPLDGSLPTRESQAGPLPPNHDVGIPLRLYKKLATLVGEHLRTRERPNEAAKRMFEAIDPNNRASEATLRPRIEHWIKSTEWFVKRAHDRGKTDAEMGGDQLKKNFEVFEAALSAMVRDFFKTVDDLDEILEEANS